jgi:hypothetical protein
VGAGIKALIRVVRSYKKDLEEEVKEDSPDLK